MMTASVVLPRPGRAEDQHVIERLGAPARRLDEDGHLALDLFLADIFAEGPRPDGPVDQLVVAAPGGADQALIAHRTVHSRAAPCSAPRMTSSMLPPGSAFLSRRVASLGR